MKHVTIKNLAKNSEIVFSLKEYTTTDRMRISCSDFYTVFIDGKVCDFGPERTAKGYTRIKTVQIGSFSSLVIRVYHCGIPTFDLEEQPFFLGVEILNGERTVKDVSDFAVTDNPQRLFESCKYSPQRAFAERYDLRTDNFRTILTQEIPSPKTLSSAGVLCEFKKIIFDKKSSGDFCGFEERKERAWLKNPIFAGVGDYDVDKTLDAIENGGYKYCEYELGCNSSGLLGAEVSAKENGQKLFLFFDEYLPQGKTVFGRSNCNDFIEITLKRGVNRILSAVPYTFKYVTAVYNGKCDIKPFAILIQNDEAKLGRDFADEKVEKIAVAALNTFRQNAFDIFTDCPGRERAGWLCDSYFTGIAEEYFTGKRNVERNFLENFIIGNCSDVPERMLPMCYPARHTDKTFIPNWAMWFVAELYEYFKATGDIALINAAKKKVYGLLDYFKEYENEFGFLENLPSWVFVEWSKANDADFIKGVSFPTNILYAGMLVSAGILYKDDALIKKSAILSERINEFSFDGKYYCDNAETEGGKLKPCRNHVSETCQYYALFFEIAKNRDFKERMANDFSLPQKDNPDGVVKSSVFIGNFLRIFWLLKEKRYEKILSETKDYFYDMSVQTGTLWEKAEPTASCNHGFASCMAFVLDQCVSNGKH